jgi:hypothetical protein
LSNVRVCEIARAENELQQGFGGIFNLAEDSFEVAVIGPREQHYDIEREA